MQLVPVEDTAHQWESFFRNISRGDKDNKFSLNARKAEQVEGIPVSVTNQDGQIIAPNVAGNVLPPKESKPESPKAYEHSTPSGTSAGTDEMGRKKKKSRHRGPKRIRKRAVKRTRKNIKKRSSGKKRARQSIKKGKK